ncbi:MAG: cell division protein FtsA, partial [Candidatus Accumulibacter sp.]|nr:cell division protein FtsA [Accumulibacter sp.]
MSRENKEIIVGLDIGTTKVVVLVAEVTPDDRLNVIGMGSQDSRGLKKGVVVNIEDAVATISRVIQEVELMADCKVKDVYTGIAGKHIRSFNSNGMVAIKDKEVTTMDVDRVIETARAMPIPSDQEILHILTQEFIIDDQEGIREPIGLSGFRLEVKVHIVTGAVSAAQNIVKCVRRCGLEVNDLVLQPLASSYAVLSEDDKNLGVCLVDIGGGTTDLAVWTQGAIRHTKVIPIAGDQITFDIAFVLKTPMCEAEDIKCKFGCALSELADPEEIFDVAGVDDQPSRKLSRRALADVIQLRVEELFEMILAELRLSGFEQVLSSGLVLTGGSSVMPGMIELGEEVFHMPVRLGIPRYSGALASVIQSPRFATSYGLLLEACAQKKRG